MKKISLLCLILLAAATTANAADFEIKGIKGLWWEGIEKYELALPWLAEHDLNFLMLCYSSFPASGMDWRAEYSPEELARFRALTAKGKELGVDVCLSWNPGIWSKPPIVYSDPKDLEISFDKVKTMHAMGIRWFALCLDDINQELQPADKERFGTLAAAQSYYVNRLWDQMKSLNPRPKLIFCPSAYTTGEMRKHMEYTLAVGRDINREVLMFWTGPEVCSPSISAEDANLVAKWLRRKPFVWDNYPVNDMFPWRPLVSPVKARSTDLGSAVSGFISNPMKQWHASRIPLATIAAYLNSPAGYDPEKATESVIRSYPADQQRAIRLLVDLYGSSFWGEDGFPPQVRVEKSEQARKLLPKYRVLRREMSSNSALADLWEDIRPTVELELAVLDRAAVDRRLSSPLNAVGIDFEGGAASLFSRIHKGRSVNYVYAKPTQRDSMRTEFYLKNIPENGAVLRILGLTDDHGTNPKIEITLNDHKVHNGPAGFSRNDFECREFSVPMKALKPDVNVLTIRCLEENGVLGMPPWFMVAEAELALAD